MKFIRTTSGLINLVHVVRIDEQELRQDGLNPFELKSVTTIEYRDQGGETLIATAFESPEEIESRCAPIIPALAGFFEIDVFDDEPHELFMMPIVGWRIVSEIALPVSFHSTSEWSAILSPDGHVTRPMERTWGTAQDFRSHRITEIREQTAKAK